jgi:hypothetical protein
MLEKSGQSLSPCVEVNGHSRRAALTAAVSDAPANLTGPRGSGSISTDSSNMAKLLKIAN